MALHSRLVGQQSPITRVDVRDLAASFLVQAHRSCPFHSSRQHHLRTATHAATDTRSTESQEASWEATGKFTCTSSPAIEQNMRTLGRNITRVDRWSKDIFSDKVEYKDNFRSFTGKQKYSRLRFHRDCLQDPRATILMMRMKQRNQGCIDYRVSGKLAGQAINVKVMAKFDFNDITGSVLKHTQEIDVSRLSAPASAAYTARRAAWSAAQLRQDLAEGLQDRNQKDRPSNITVDPTDPQKFFQDNDNTFNDGVTFATILAVLWLAATAWYQLDKVKL